MPTGGRAIIDRAGLNGGRFRRWDAGGVPPIDAMVQGQLVDSQLTCCKIDACTPSAPADNAIGSRVASESCSDTDRKDFNTLYDQATARYSASGGWPEGLVCIGASNRAEKDSIVALLDGAGACWASAQASSPRKAGMAAKPAATGSTPWVLIELVAALSSGGDKRFHQLGMLQRHGIRRFRRAP